MTKETRRELDKCVEKIRRYPKGFEFTINYSVLPREKYNAMRFVLDVAEMFGLIKSVSIGLSLESMTGKTNCYANEETFRRV